MDARNEELLALFNARDEDAIREAERLFGRYCRCIADRIVGESEGEDVVNDALLKAWNTIPPQQPTHMKGYFGMLTRQLALNKLEKLTAEKRGGAPGNAALDELAELLTDGSDVGETVALRDALDRFLRGLPTKTRRIFLRRYWYACDLSEIAADFSMKESTVAMQLLRTRQKLQEFLRNEGFIQ